MTMTTTIVTEPGGEDFRTGEGLRQLLLHLHREGTAAWREDPVAGKLMEFAARKYAALARKHGLDPWEAASAAFEVMRTKAARRAADPWAVITHAVRITCIAEERGQGLLCSTHQARRPRYSRFHDAERFSDRENPLADYHEAFHTTDSIPGKEEVESETDRVVEDAILFFTLLGWPEGTVRAASSHVCWSLARLGSRASAYEALRRDKHARALLDVPSSSWTVLLRALLGHTDAAYGATGRGQGILLRLLIGQDLLDLFEDDELVTMVGLAAPGRIGGGS